MKKEFDFNIQKIVNFRVKQGKNVYMYDKDGKILYYSSYSLNGIKNVLGLHPTTTSKCQKYGYLYLDYD